MGQTALELADVAYGQVAFLGQLRQSHFFAFAQSTDAETQKLVFGLVHGGLFENVSLAILKPATQNV